ncbi:efflux RND transporter periplasmic adaptor subunit, partial [Patescibacteria group bacterium]
TAEFVVANPDKLVFKARVDEVDIGSIKEGLNTIIILDSYPDEEIELVVSKIDFTSTATSGGGTAFVVEFMLPNTEEQKFRLGMNGDAEINVKYVSDVLTVPLEAIQENAETYVWKMENEKPVKVEVKTGISDDFDMEILTGLQEGDEVIVSGFKNIKD